MYRLDTECSEKGYSYVGETVDPEGRQGNWNKANNKSYGGQKINNARIKYGVKDWTRTVLETVEADTSEELKVKLKEREGYWIDKYDSVNKGFNTSKGGTGNKGVVFTEEHRKRCGDSMRGKHHTEETKKKISESQKGKTVSEATREKISKGNKGKKRTDAQRHALSESRKGVEPKAASEGAAKWRAANPGGWWKTHPISEETKAKLRESKRAAVPDIKVTYKDGSTAIFPSMKATADNYGVNVGSIGWAIQSNTVPLKLRGEIIKIEKDIC